MELTDYEWVCLWAMADHLLTNGYISLDDLDDDDKEVLSKIKNGI